MTTSHLPLPSSDFSSNPFPGLRPFHTEEHHLFFGREEQTAALLGLLRQHRFLAVVGTSGSGKSSLVRAGLIPALHRGTMARAGTSWEVILLRPGGNPITSLARSLLEADLYDAGDPEAVPRLRATLTRSLFGLVEAVRQSRAVEPDTNLLVVVDQFEELFRFRQQGVDSEETATAFVNALLAAAQAEDRRIYVVITMRSDYLGDCAQIPGLAEAVNHGEYLIPRLTRDQRRDAIEKPVGVGGARIAPRLVQHMLNDLGDDPDQLPVLQHALMRTWEAWFAEHAGGQPLDLSHYEATGGMASALSRHADEVFAALPDGEHREAAERLFKALTVKGADNRGIRRPTRLGKLAFIAGASEATVKAVVDAYRQPGVTFLMPGTLSDLGPETVIDLSHESLMRVWRRLSAWVEEEAQSARVYRRLAETAALWEKGEAGLYHDPDLQITRTWRDQSGPNAAWAEQYGGGFDLALGFLDRSRESAEAAERAREEAQRRELEQAKRLAEAERRQLQVQKLAAKRLKVFAAGLAVVAAMAVGAFFLAVKASREAVTNAKLAGDKEVAATEAAGRAERAAADLKRTLVASDFAQGVEAIERGEGADGLGYLARALRTDGGFWPAGMRAMSVLSSGRFPLRTFDPIEQEKVITTYRLNDKEDLLFTSDAANDVEKPQRFVWDARTGRRLYDLATGQKMSGDTNWTEDGKFLVGYLEEEKTINVREARTGKEACPPLATEGVGALRLGQHPVEGALILSRYLDGSLQVWKAANGRPLTERLKGASPASDGQGFTPGARRVYGILGDATIVLWDAVTGAPAGEISTRPYRATEKEKLKGGIFFTPDGETVVARSDDGKHVNWWRPGGENPGAKWLEFEDQVEVLFLPGARKVAFVTTFVTPAPSLLRIRVHDLETRAETARIDTPRPVGRAFWSFDPALKTLRFSLAAAVEGNVTRIWDLETGGIIREIFAPAILNFAMFSPEGRRVLTLSTGSEIMIWDLLSGAALLSEPLKHENVSRVSFSPDGEKLLTYDLQKLVVQVWDSRSGRRLAEPVPEGNIGSFLFPAGGQRLLLWQYQETTNGPNFRKQTTGRFRLFDLGQRPVLFEPLVHGSGSTGEAAFTPDGKEMVVLGRVKPGDPEGIMVFDARERRLERNFTLSQAASAFKLSPDGSRVAVNSNDGRVRIFDLARGDLVHELLHDAYVRSFSFSADGSRLVTGTAQGKVRVWDPKSGAPLTGALDFGDQPIQDVLFSPDGALIASSSQDFKFRLADARTGAARDDPLTLDNVVQTAAFAADGSYVVVLPFSPDIPIVEVASGKVVRKLHHNDACRTLRFSPDGSLLAISTGGNYNLPLGEVFFWDWRAGKTVSRPLKTHGSVRTMEFSKDGSLLATGNLLPDRAAAQVWDVASGLPLTDPLLGRGGVTAVAFNPQETEVLAAWSDGTVRVLDLPPRSVPQAAWLPRLAEAVAGRKIVPGAGGVESVSRDELARARAEMAAAAAAGGTPGEPTARWAEWFFSESPDRTISPGSKMTFREYLGRLRRSSRIEDLQDALKLEPADGLTHARIGLVFLENLASQGDLDRQKEVSARLRRHWEETAAWYGRRAVELEPENPEAWALRAEILGRLGRNEEAGEAVTRSLELDPSRAEASSPNAWYLKALALARERNWTEAEKAFATAIEGVSSGAGDRRKGGAVPLLGVLAALEPTRTPAAFREIRLPEPLPGTFEDFDSVPEGGVPPGWSASHEPTDAPRAPEASARLDTPLADVFEDWIAVSRDRASRFGKQPFFSERTLVNRRLERVNGTFTRRLLHGRFLYSLSGERNSSNVHHLSTPDYDCSKRAGVQVAFHSVYEQSATTVAGLEYSIDGGKTWLPVFYRLNALQAVQDASGKIDAEATLKKNQDYPPLFIDAAGRPRGSAYGDFIGAPLGRDLDPYLQGLRAFNTPETNRVEVCRLARADGQPKVRLRFLHAGRMGWYWAIDDFGLYEIPEGGMPAAPEVLDRTRDPGLLALFSLATLLGKDPNADSSSDPDALFETAGRLQHDLPPFGASGRDPVPGESSEERIRVRRTLDARLLGLRALSLAPEDRDLLVWTAVTALETGDLEAAEELARKALKKGMTRELVLAFRGVFTQKGVKLEKAGDEKAAGVSYELAHVLSLAATQSGDRNVLERLAAAGLIAESDVLLPRESEWRYLDDGSEPGPAWKDPAFDDTLWLGGKARLGYGNDGEKTAVSPGPSQQRKNITVYFRAAFEVKEQSRYEQLKLSVQRDDGVVVYLNGQEVARDNLPLGDILPKTLALRIVNDNEEKRWYVFDVPASGLRAGRNVIAAEVHQQSASSSDLGFDLELEGTGGLKETDRPFGELEAIEDRIGVPLELRSVLWTSRAERYLRAGALERAAEALERAARSGSGNPAVDYQRALLLQARGEGEAAYRSYLKAAQAVIALKAAPGSAYETFLPEGLIGPVEPLVKATGLELGLGLAAAAGRLARMVHSSRETETRWLLRWSEELDAKSHEARRQRAEVLLALGRSEEALSATDTVLAEPEPQAGAPPHLFRERKEWLALRERCLRREQKITEADAVREEIFKRPPRDPALGPKHLDLSAYYNAGIYDGRDWHGDVSLSTLPESFRPREGVLFDIRGMIQLNGPLPRGTSESAKDLNGHENKNYPYEVTGIRVGLKTQALHLLLSACWDRAQEGAELARIVVRYEDGLEEPFSLKQIEDVADWAVGQTQKIDPDRVAWIGGRPQLRMVQRKTWKNPHPEKTIREIDFASTKATAAPFLIALTAE